MYYHLLVHIIVAVAVSKVTLENIQRSQFNINDDCQRNSIEYWLVSVLFNELPSIRMTIGSNIVPLMIWISSSAYAKQSLWVN